jgi:hypothetical protein
MIKFKMIYSILSEEVLKKINERFIQVNVKKRFEKTPEAMQKYEERDDISEYDDGGEYIREFEAKEENNFEVTIKSYENKSTNSPSNPEFVSSNSDSK